MRRVKNAAQFTKARELLALSKVDIAKIMQMPNPQSSGYRRVLRWEQDKPPGYAMTMMEALLSGWRPSWFNKEGESK